MVYTAIPSADSDFVFPPAVSTRRTPRYLAPTILAFDILRSSILATLTGLSIAACLYLRKNGVGSLSDVFGRRDDWTLELGVAIVYSILLTLSVVLSFLRHGTYIQRTISTILHLSLLAVFGVYAYRDLYPLITTSLSPIDTFTLPAYLVWSRISLLSIASILLPFFKPNHFIPVDDYTPAHPEEIASYASFIFFSFMDSLIFSSWSSTIPYEKLPPLAGYDKAEYLAQTQLLRMHPVRRQELGLKKKHLVWGMVSVYWKVYLAMASMVVSRSILEFASPIGINRLLTYLQNDNNGKDGDATLIKPWFWIIALFLGPTLSSISWQIYNFISTRTLVKTEALITSMLFQHSLRIKMKDSVEDSSPTLQGSSTPAIIVDTPIEIAKGDIIDATQAGAVIGLPAGSSSDGDASSTIRSSPSPDTTNTTAPHKEASIAGRINTLITNDIESVVEGRDVFMFLFYGPLQISLGTFFLYKVLSWSGPAAILVTMFTLPIPGMLAKILNKTQADLSRASEARIQVITEAINTLRMVKLFGWEEKIAERIAEKRDLEMAQIKRRTLYRTLVGTVNWCLPILSIVLCYGLYTGVEKQTLTSAKIFSSITVFEMLRFQMYQVTGQLTTFIQAKVSMQRLNAFLTETELLDGLKEDAPLPPAEGESDKIFFRNATFTWTEDDVEFSRFRLHIDDLEIPRGKTTLVSGKTSAGKSSLLLALLGEMNWKPSGPDSTFHLPRSSGVAYAAQEAWVMADTVRNNIVLDSPWDAERYQKVIHQCALERDLELFAAGDQTELGEKGLNASGGQKARISLARAVYSRANILLLDDPLSALDLTTCKWVVEKCFKGDLMRERTVILVTHHVTLATPISDYLVHIALDGTIDYQGAPEKALEFEDEDPVISEEIVEKVEEFKEDAEVVTGDLIVKQNLGKLVVDEEKSEGRVSLKTVLKYLAAAGGPIFWSIYLADILIGELLFAGCNYWLGLWSRAYERAENPSEVSIVWYLSIYVVLMLVQVSSYNTSGILWMFGSLRASRVMHVSLVQKILGSTFRFIDKTPTGRLISRAGRDFKALDGQFTAMFSNWVEIICTLALKFILLVWIVPIFTPIALLIAIAGALVGEMYLKAQLNVKREMSNAKSPLYSQFAAAVNGVVSIRAYGAEKTFVSSLRASTDRYTRCATTFYNLTRWVTIRIDFLGAVFSATLATVLFYAGHNFLDAALVGFLLNQATSFADVLLWAARMTNELSVQAQSIERINDYLVIDQEPASTEKGKPPASWPTSGDIVIQDLTARYYEGGPIVLDNLSLTIPSGSRIAVVGRTGSGKSTLTMALLRAIPTTGMINISGLDTRAINLDALRSHVTIIPQDPILLSGTLRFNLDPFGEHEDYELFGALKSSGLDYASGMAGSSGTATPTVLTLDTQISSGGGNLSQGQRQLVALARALVRGSKILVLDEATASVDHATDALVQQAIRSQHGVTILTVAHRLSTIMDYDKVMVLGAGKLLEYDTPASLLRNPDGYFRALVNDSSDKEELEKLANEGRT